MGRVIAFIPMRSSSKGIPDKNIKELDYQPLYVHTICPLIASQVVDEIIVATDSEKYRDLIQDRYDVERLKIYMRNPENAQDNSSTEDVMLEYIQQSDLQDDDIFLLCQITQPLIQVEDVKGVLDLIQNKGFDSALTGVDISDRFIWNTFENYGIYQSKPINYDYKNRPRRQDKKDFDKMFIENGGMYGCSVLRIKKYKNRLSGKIGIWAMDKRSIFEIDEPSDWYLIEELI